MKNIELNPYKTIWAIIEPVKGIVTKQDVKKMEASRMGNNKIAVKFFLTKERMMKWVKQQEVSKRYSVKYCYDKQFGIGQFDENGKFCVKFTKKQNEEVNYIG